MSLDRTPELGANAVPLIIKLAPVRRGREPLADGLRQMYRRGEFTDVVFSCAERSFPAHRVVLAAQSKIFKESLAPPPGAPATGTGTDNREEVRLADIANPEALKFMLDYLYQSDADLWEDYNPRTQEINKDVLRLAQSFCLPGLTERATHWLAKDLTTGNVVERLTICEEFGLADLREQILAQLANNRRALAEITNSPQIIKYPQLMMALLQRTAANCDDSPRPKKRAKKA